MKKGSRAIYTKFSGRAFWWRSEDTRRFLSHLMFLLKLGILSTDVHFTLSHIEYVYVLHFYIYTSQNKKLKGLMTGKDDSDRKASLSLVVLGWLLQGSRTHVMKTSKERKCPGADKSVATTMPGGWRGGCQPEK